MAVFSKALGNGYPIAAIIGKGIIMDAAQESFISSTYWTERIGSAAALATIKKHHDFAVGDHLIFIGESVQEGWKKSAGKNGITIAIGGIAPLSHFAFQYDNPMAMKAYFVQFMLDRGFLASTLFYAMYAHKPQHIEAYIGAVDDAFSSIAHLTASGALEKELRGSPASQGFTRLT
jgi:glutamate-1-semialdehyde aminotransferase